MIGVVRPASGFRPVRAGAFGIDRSLAAEGCTEGVFARAVRTNFEIDLSATNAARRREKLAKYLDHGTRVTPQTRRSRRGVQPPPSGRDQVQAVRRQ
jgi:hypothetical protein